MSTRGMGSRGWRQAAQVVIPVAALLAGRAALAADTMPAQQQQAPQAKDTVLPAQQQADGINYVSGGDDYRAAKTFEQSLDKYPLAIELVQKAGPQSAKDNHVTNEFTANANVKIMDKGGKEVFAAESAGPFMLVDLPPGQYTMTATLGKTTLHKSDLNIIKGKSERATFIFPTGTA